MGQIDSENAALLPESPATLSSLLSCPSESCSPLKQLRQVGGLSPGSARPGLAIPC